MVRTLLARREYLEFQDGDVIIEAIIMVLACLGAAKAMSDIIDTYKPIEED